MKTHTPPRFKRRTRLSKTIILRALVLSLALCFADAPAHAQHEGHTMPQPTPQPSPTPKPKEAAPPQTQSPSPTPTPPDHSHHGHAAPTPTPAVTTDHSQHVGAGEVDHSAHGGATEGGLMVMEGERMGVRVGASASNFMPMGQMGSGTAWQPGSSPMYMWHKLSGEWLFMLHGEVKLGVNSQGGPRGVTKFESQNWVMPMAFRRVGRGTLQLRGMFSLEPLTFSGAGSPQLFQVGEVYQGQPIRDFQHPHDLFMELSAQYTLPVGERGTWYAYFGFPGEPALGPVAFMHRASASENPTAPLAHHFQDSTHISFGVLTSGFTYRWLKVEGSVFNGREPDDKRYGFEFNPFTSRSVRVSVAPNENWAVQYSYGLLRNPEFFAPGDTHRQTASVQYNRPLQRGNFAAAFIWGRNREEHDGQTFRLNGYTAEATWNFLDKNYLYTRLELADREGDDLLSHDELHDLGFDDHQHPQFRVGAYTFGAARDFWETDKLSVALGGDATFYSKPGVLDALYGNNPTSYKFFIRFRPRAMKADDHSGHGAN
ncbi:MAG TPA: hypothetical protein VFS10_17050 [Pyrinomonadaceae bacterium]|nr:hypothetical protein [Pyrinomonadaceae bacterium]